MCRPSPGPRCSDHSKSKLTNIVSKVKWAEARIQELEEEYPSLTPGSRSASTNRRILQNTKERLIRLQDKEVGAVLEYNATPGGQKELVEKLAEPSLESNEKERLQADLELAQARRAWQKRMAKELRNAKQMGGMGQALMVAQLERQRLQREGLDVDAELGRNLFQREQVDQYSRTPQGKQPSNLMKIVNAFNIFNNTLYKLKVREVMISLMKDDLDGFIVRQGSVLGKSLLRNTAKNVATGLVTSVLK